MQDETKKNPNCDFILREDAIDLFTRFIEEEPKCREALRAIQTSLLGLPQGWIPCSERLPEKSGYYLATIINAFDEKEVCVIWFAHKADYDVWGWRQITNSDIVIAWMPLPTPYKGGDSE